jgi:REP element-mobilizing transposase RayT
MQVAQQQIAQAQLTAVTLNAYARKPLLAREGALDLLRVTLVYYRPQLRYAVFGFAGLADHLHLLMRPLGGIGIERILREIKASYSRKYHQLYRRHGSVWQPKYFVREVEGVYAVEAASGRLPGLTSGTPRAQRGQASGA